MSTIPTLTAENIRTFVGEQNFLKSQQFVRDGAIVNPEQLETTHNTLVEAALDEGEIERTLQLLEATKPPGPEGYQWQYDYARTPEVALKAAE